MLATHRSSDLRAILTDMLKYSTNLTAELVGLTATRKRLGHAESIVHSAEVIGTAGIEYPASFTLPYSDVKIWVVEPEPPSCELEQPASASAAIMPKTVRRKRGVMDISCEAWRSRRIESRATCHGLF